jgi:hypothetical protein
MSISSETRKAGPYTGNGSTTAFPFAFKVFSAADVQVIHTITETETILTLTTHYTVSINANQDANPGGTVAMNSAPASGVLITLASIVANFQPVTLTNAGGFYPKVINDALDRVTILVQQLAEKVSRAVKVNISSSITPDQLVGEIVSAVASSTASAVSAAASADEAAAAVAAVTLPIPISSGGTGGTTSAEGRAALGLAIGSDVQAYIAPGAAGNILVSNGSELVSSLVPAPVIADWSIAPEKLAQKITIGTSVVTTSGTAVDFTGIPSWVKRITAMFADVSTNGTSGVSVQIGDSGGIETAGYAAATSNGSSSTTEFPLSGGSGAPPGVLHGVFTLVLVSGNTWSASSVISRTDVAAAFSMAGSKTLSNAIDRVRIRTGNGTDAFDAGLVNILYEG